MMNPTIMAVDDDPGILALLEIIFKRKGYTVITAGGAYQALATLDREKPDLFILDVMMPGISGIELCKQLRSRLDTARTPIILLSGWSDAQSMERGLAAGANAYLPKMTSHIQILNKVDALLKEACQQLRSAM